MLEVEESAFFDLSLMIFVLFLGSIYDLCCVEEFAFFEGIFCV